MIENLIYLLGYLLALALVVGYVLGAIAAIWMLLRTLARFMSE